MAFVAKDKIWVSSENWNFQKLVSAAMTWWLPHTVKVETHTPNDQCKMPQNRMPVRDSFETAQANYSGHYGFRFYTCFVVVANK